MTYRVTVMVTTDVEADDEGEAMSLAINSIRQVIDEDPEAPHPKPFWITGIAQDASGYLVFGR